MKKHVMPHTEERSVELYLGDNLPKTFVNKVFDLARKTHVVLDKDIVQPIPTPGYDKYYLSTTKDIMYPATTTMRFMFDLDHLAADEYIGEVEMFHNKDETLFYLDYYSPTSS